MKKGPCATMTHDYKRNDTNTLLPPLISLAARSSGAVCSVTGVRNLSAFSKLSSAKCRRFTFHFTPTSCSWGNAIEGLFAKLTRHRLKRGVFTSIAELQAAINRSIAETTTSQSRSSDAILAAVQRGRQALEAIHYPAASATY